MHILQREDRGKKTVCMIMTINFSLILIFCHQQDQLQRDVAMCCRIGGAVDKKAFGLGSNTPSD